MDEKTRKIFVVVLFFLAKENTVIGANNGGDCGSFKAVWSPVNGKRNKPTPKALLRKSRFSGKPDVSLLDDDSEFPPVLPSISIRWSSGAIETGLRCVHAFEVEQQVMYKYKKFSRQVWNIDLLSILVFHRSLAAAAGPGLSGLRWSVAL